jgi:hypothetical protein
MPYPKSFKDADLGDGYIIMLLLIKLEGSGTFIPASW